MRLIGRRNFLAGMGLGAGSRLLGSMFGTMLPTALGAATAGRKRFIIFTGGNGFLQRDFEGTIRSVTDFDLNPAVYGSVAPYKSQMILASHFYNPHSAILHGNGGASLCAMPPIGNGGGSGGISIDRFIAKQIGTADPILSTVQSVSWKASSQGKTTSSDGGGQQLPSMISPVRAYETYFGAGITPSGAAPDMGKTLSQDKSLMDYIAGDIGRMNARLAGPEKAKLDQYVTSLRGVEKQLVSLQAARTNCQAPAKPTVTGTTLDPNVVAAHVDVAFAAQMCGLTRVSHVSILGWEGPNENFGFCGGGPLHTINHANDQPKLTKVAEWIMSKVGQMVAHLAKTPEGGGTMLDNSLVVYFNTCGSIHHMGQKTNTAVMVGRAGGALKTGQYLRYPIGQRSVADLFSAWASAMGAPTKTFGDAALNRGPLAEMLA